MSHFTVLVIGLATAIEAQLQPFHEFECTGTDDQYVQDIDRTEEARAAFAKATVTRVRDQNGVLHDMFDENGNWKPEFSVEGKNGRREQSLPPGYTEEKVPAKDYENEAEWIVGYFGGAILPHGQTPGEEHKYGRVELDAEGNVVRVIDRTNPNKKWDWWQIGGRWSGFFTLKPGAEGVRGKEGAMGSHRNAGEGFADQARKGDIDFERMRREASEKAGVEWDKIRAIVGDMDSFITWEKMYDEVHPGNIDAARAAYAAQPQNVALNAAVDAELEANPSKDSDLVWVELAPFKADRELFQKRAADAISRTFAVLKDGQWYERGRMGWWGCVADERDADRWNDEFVALIDGLPDDTVLTVVDCHI